MAAKNRFTPSSFQAEKESYSTIVEGLADLELDLAHVDLVDRYILILELL